MYSVEATHCNIPPRIMQLLTNSQFSKNYLSAIRYFYVVFSMHRLSYTTESLGLAQISRELS